MGVWYVRRMLKFEDQHHLLWDSAYLKKDKKVQINNNAIFYVISKSSIKNIYSLYKKYFKKHLLFNQKCWFEEILLSGPENLKKFRPKNFSNDPFDGILYYSENNFSWNGFISVHEFLDEWTIKKNSKKFSLTVFRTSIILTSNYRRWSHLVVITEGIRLELFNFTKKLIPKWIFALIRLSVSCVSSCMLGVKQLKGILSQFFSISRKNEEDQNSSPVWILNIQRKFREID